MVSSVCKPMLASSEPEQKDTVCVSLALIVHADVCVSVCLWVCMRYSLAAGGLAAFGVKGDMVVSAVCLGEGGYPLKQSGS